MTARLPPLLMETYIPSDRERYAGAGESFVGIMALYSKGRISADKALADLTHLFEMFNRLHDNDDDDEEG